MENRDIAQALFGRDAIQFGRGPAGRAEPQQIRQRNGFWMHESGPQNRRVAAVLTVVQLHPWNSPRVAPMLWLNPWAENPLGDHFPFTTATASEKGRVTYVERQADLPKIFGLSPSWPEGGPSPANRSDEAIRSPRSCRPRR
jgi:hypothetical protein